MDIFVVDLAYILTIGAPPKNMLPQQKVNHVVDKVMSFVNNTSCNKDLPISLTGNLDLNLDLSSDCSCSNNLDVSGSSIDVSGNTSFVQLQNIIIPTTDDNESNSDNNIQFSRINNNPQVNTPVIKKIDSYDENKKSIIKEDVLDEIKQNHQTILLQYFSERDNVFQLTEECRNLRKSLYDTGNLDEIELLISNEDKPFDLSDEYLELNAVHDNNLSASVKTINGDLNILHSDIGFKKNDTLISRKNNNFYFFKVKKIKNLVSTKQLSPMNWNIPIHTQIYRHFYPNMFDVDKINGIQNDLKKHGIEFVVAEIINEYYETFK